MRPGNRARFSLGARLVSQVLVGRLSGGIRALRIEMRLGSFGACVWIKGTMAKLLHVYRFADQHCAKTAHSHDHHGHSARLALKLKGTQRHVLWGIGDDVSLVSSSHLQGVDVVSCAADGA